MFTGSTFAQKVNASKSEGTGNMALQQMLLGSSGPTKKLHLNINQVLQSNLNVGGQIRIKKAE